MVEWLALGISIVGVLITLILEKDKVNRLINDYYSWKTQLLQKREGEVFIEKIEKKSIKAGKGELLSMPLFFFFLLMIASGIAGLLEKKLPIGLELIGSLVMSSPLILIFLGLLLAVKRKKIGIIQGLIVFIFGGFTLVFIGFGWGNITKEIIDSGISVFWAGAISTTIFTLMVLFVSYINMGAADRRKAKREKLLKSMNDEYLDE